MGARMTAPWYRQVSGAQWKAFLTTFAAWVLDAFDFTILTFVLADIQQSFSVNKALAGLLRPTAGHALRHQARIGARAIGRGDGMELLHRVGGEIEAEILALLGHPLRP